MSKMCCFWVNIDQNPVFLGSMNGFGETHGDTGQKDSNLGLSWVNWEIWPPYFKNQREKSVEMLHQFTPRPYGCFFIFIFFTVISPAHRTALLRSTFTFRADNTRTLTTTGTEARDHMTQVPRVVRL